MRPVADQHLRNYLERPLNDSTDRNARKQCVRTFFGCLIKALEYFHLCNIQHKDIKPHNILIKRNEVYLTDFGTAKAHGEASRSNSAGPVRGYTPRYAAPEIIVFDPHGKPSDIWSMGCFLLEMVTVLHDRTLDSMGAFYLQQGSGIGQYHSNQEASRLWIDELSSLHPAGDIEVLTWIRGILEPQPAYRPTVSQVLASISDAQSEHRFFCFACLEHGFGPETFDARDTLTAPMLQDILRKSHGADNVSDHSEDTVTAEFLEKVGAVPYADTEDAPSVELTGDLVKKAESASADDVSPSVESSERAQGTSVPNKSLATIIGSETGTGVQSIEPIRFAIDSRSRGQGISPRPSKQVRFEENKIPLAEKSSKQESERPDRFSGLHADRRPVPTESEPEIVDIDDQSILAPELLKPPPIDSKDCYPLPQATFVPSYILAGSNRFTADEVRSIDPTIQFVRLREIDAPKCRAWLCGLLSQGCLLIDAPKTFVPVSSRLVKSKLIDQACS